MGMPDEQIKLKMKAEKVDPEMLDRPDEVSPNDPGVSCWNKLSRGCLSSDATDWSLSIAFAN